EAPGTEEPLEAARGNGFVQETVEILLLVTGQTGDTFGPHRLDELLAGQAVELVGVVPEWVEMPDGLAVLGQARRQDAGDLLQRGGEARGVFAAPNRVLAQLVELLQEHSRLEVLHADVAAAREIGPCPLEVPVRAPAVVERAGPIDEIVTIAGDRATFARRQVLGVLDAEAAQVADRPARVSPVLREPGLAGVLDDR